MPLEDKALPALLLDAGGSSVSVAMLAKDRSWAASATAEDTALESLFPLVEQVLASSQTELADLRGFIYSEGPGSVLGLRLAAMAIETWRALTNSPPPLFAYNSLALTAALLAHDRPDLRDALLISEWKKNAWNAVQFRDGACGPVEVIDDGALDAWDGPLFHLPQRKAWQAAPDRAERIVYEPLRLSELPDGFSLLIETDGIELYQTAATSFTKWKPERHRAPTNK